MAIGLGKPMIFLGLDFLPATLGAMSLGFLMRRNFLQVMVVYIILLSAFLINPLTLWLVELPNGVAVPYNWLHVAAIILLTTPFTRKAVGWVIAPSITHLARGLVILCFIGTTIQHLTGGVIFELVFGFALGQIPVEAWPGLWGTLFYIYPIERIFIVVVSTLIGTAAIKSLRVKLKWAH